MGCSQRLAPCLWHSVQIEPDLTFFVTDAGSQLTFEMGEGGRTGINKNVTHAGSQLTFEMGEGGGAGISKNVTHAGSQLSFEMFRYEWRPVSITPNPTDVCCEEG